MTILKTIAMNQVMGTMTQHVATALFLITSSIDQTNDATVSVATNEVDQDNNVEIYSVWNLDNTCDETDDGNNLAECNNFPNYGKGPVSQTNTATELRQQVLTKTMSLNKRVWVLQKMIVMNQEQEIILHFVKIVI